MRPGNKNWVAVDLQKLYTPCVHISKQFMRGAQATAAMVRHYAGLSMDEARIS